MIATLDAYPVLLDRRRNRRDCRMGWLEAQRSVRPVTIVMCDEDAHDLGQRRMPESNIPSVNVLPARAS
jgi:hypothetical protein